MQFHEKIFFDLFDFTSFFAWNFWILFIVFVYFFFKSILLDSELIAQTERQLFIQSMIYKSPIMWLVIFLWRWINSVSMMFIFMITVVFEKTDEYLNFVKSHGILILTTVTLITYIHYTYALAQISEIWLKKIV